MKATHTYQIKDGNLQRKYHETEAPFKVVWQDVKPAALSESEVRYQMQRYARSISPDPVIMKLFVSHLELLKKPAAG